MEMDKLGVVTTFLHNIVVYNIPLLYGTVGEIMVEKSGSLNLGVEGIMAVVFILASQATMMPVQPTSSVMVVDRIPAVPTLKAAARPMRQAERNTVRRTMRSTFMPAYRAVPAESPTTAIS